MPIENLNRSATKVLRQLADVVQFFSERRLYPKHHKNDHASTGQCAPTADWYGAAVYHDFTIVGSCLVDRSNLLSRMRQAKSLMDLVSKGSALGMDQWTRGHFYGV